MEVKRRACPRGMFYFKRAAFQIGQWHVVSVAICGTHGVLRVDDGSHRAATFSCAPVPHNLDHAMKVGEGFRGQIQQIAINFTPLQLRVPKVTLVVPWVQLILNELICLRLEVSFRLNTMKSTRALLPVAITCSI